jgi:hypothetical protein
MIKSCHFDIFLVMFFAVMLSFTAPSHAEKIVIMRHGEKPLTGLGQLDCQGLNRALALTGVLATKFGKPDHIFAPNPAEGFLDHDVGYNYIRPLATIEPTAIYFGLPVNTNYGYSNTGDLAVRLLKPGHALELIFVAWEHVNAVELMKKIVSLVGGNVSVPNWPDSDYDSLYILDIDPTNPAALTLTHEQEGLNGLSTICPLAHSREKSLSSTSKSTGWPRSTGSP